MVGLRLNFVATIHCFNAFVIGQSNDNIGTFGAILCVIQLIPLVCSIFPTEKALKKNFDKNRRNDNISA